LLVALLPCPFIETGRGNDAAPPLKRFAQHWLAGDGFGTRVKRCRHFLEGLLPKERYEAPAHRDQLATALAIEAHDIDVCRRRDVVARAQIARRPEHAQKHLCPSVMLSETSAHSLPCSSIIFRSYTGDSGPARSSRRTCLPLFAIAPILPTYLDSCPCFYPACGAASREISSTPVPSYPAFQAFAQWGWRRC
jgi:hypothetical protein